MQQLIYSGTYLCENATNNLLWDSSCDHKSHAYLFCLFVCPQFKENISKDTDLREFQKFSKTNQPVPVRIDETSFRKKTGCFISVTEKENFAVHLMITLLCAIVIHKIFYMYNKSKTDTKPLLCIICHKYSLRKKKSLVSHKEQHGFNESEDTITESVEIDTKPLLCNFCHETFSDQNSLISHKEQHCFDETEDTITESHTKPLLCDLCHETFADRNSLVSHKEHHGFPEESINTVTERKKLIKSQN